MTEIDIFAGWYHDDIAYNQKTDEMDYRKVKITCPVCNRKFAALLSKYTKVIRHFRIDSDGELPAVEFETYCRKCRTKSTFKLECS